MVPCNSRRANENAWRFSHRKMFISKHLMFRSCLSEIVWFKFQIISSWRVPVSTATSQRGTFPTIVLREDASISGKNPKRCEEIAKEISAVANYRMDQSFSDSCSACHENLQTYFCLLSSLHMGQDLLLTLERITKQNGYKLKVHSCQNLKGIEVSVIMSENKPANLRLYEAFYTRKSTPTLNSRERNVVDSQTFYFSILQTILKHF